MSKESVKNQIDQDITNKEQPNSVTPIMVGSNMKEIVDLIPSSYTTENAGEVSLIKSEQDENDQTTLTLKGIASNSLLVSEEENNITIELPSTFQGLDYYVNNNYTGEEELGTSSKPFKTLTACIDKILNRGAFQDPGVNGGDEYNKWDLRPGVNGGAIRVIIQSYAETNENLAINRVEYFLERGGYASTLSVPESADIEYVIDMKELVDNVPKDAGKLPYELNCAITGRGTISIVNNVRKGYFRGCAFNNGTLTLEQPDSNLYIGSISGELNCTMSKKTSLAYTPLYSDVGNTIPIVREGTAMTGYQTTSVPDYGAIETQGSNAQFRDSLFLNGVIQVNCYEQHLIYAKDFGTIYGENGRIYMRRNYQHVNYSSVQNVDINPGFGPTLKFYKPSIHVYDVYLKNGASMAYAGDFYTQENTGYSQGGSEAFLCVENNTTDPTKMCNFSANGGGKVVNLFYNHYIKSILNPIFTDYQQNYVQFKDLKIDSQIFEEVISCVTTSGADWNHVISMRFVDSYLNDFFYGGNIRKPFSNIDINTYLYITGSIVGLGKGLFNSSLPVYADNTAATTAGYTIGGWYRDNSGNIKVVI